MDLVLKSLFEDFKKDFNFNLLLETQAFERFVNFSVLSSVHMSDTLDRSEIEELCIGGGNDIGLDGIAFLVNGRLVISCEEIDDLIISNNYLNATIILTQAKTSSEFSSSDIGTFGHGIIDLFSEITEPDVVHPVRNDNIIGKIQIIKHIYNNSARMIDQGLPNIKCIYATTGKWNASNTDAISRMDRTEKVLRDMGIFKNIEYEFWDTDKIKSYYQKTKSKVSVDIVFNNKITLPDITYVSESYFGVIKYSEYRKMILDNNGNIRSVFYDNIRAFQGMNNVNRRIDKTLKEKQFDLFVLLNNGVTVITKKMSPAGNKFTLFDYQIVNGCQTSHVLIQNSSIKGIDELYIPIRIICTDNDDIKKQITFATNSQTEVKQEQLISLLEFQKKLETFYLSIKGPGQLFYERLSRQYTADPSIPKYKIVTIPVQITSFISMFMEEPHQVRGYYGKIVEDFERSGKFIFNDSHKCDPYYTSGLAHHVLETYFIDGEIDRKYKPLKYFLLLGFKFSVITGKHPKQFNENYLDSYCKTLNEKLLQHEESLLIFRQCCNLISKYMNRTKFYDGDRMNKGITEYLIKTIKK